MKYLKARGWLMILLGILFLPLAVIFALAKAYK